MSGRPSSLRWGLAAVVAAAAACAPEPAAQPTESPATTVVIATTAPLTPSSSTAAPSTAYPAVAGDAVGSWVPVVLARIPHDPEAFTEGLLVDGDVVWESTGLYGSSTVRRTDRHTGEVLASEPLDRGLFGEGLELIGGNLIQLTWQEETALVWDAASLVQTGAFAYEGEGWGLCLLDDERLVMSDGSSTLWVRHPATFEVTGQIEVAREGHPVADLNELECVDGLVFANVWRTNEIVVIGDDGAVVAVIDASALEEELFASPNRDVLNGIAYDPATDTFLLTGKWWPTSFEVRFVER